MTVPRPDTACIHRHRLRVATYNIRRCLGTDRRTSPGRTAEVIASLDADIVALQEVDVNRRRSGRTDQAELIAEQVGMGFHFHPALRVVDELYGIAVLSRFPMTVVRADGLPQLIQRWSSEARGALWVEIALPGGPLQVFTTHFGLFRRERNLQAEALLGPDWLGHDAARRPVILMGDFNSRPQTASYRLLADRLRDSQALRGRPKATFPSRLPFLRIDHIFVSEDVIVDEVRVAGSALARTASDHLPLVADLSLPLAAALRQAEPMAAGELP